MLTKKDLDAFKLCPIAGGNGDRYIDGRRVRVVHRAMEGGAEGGADLERGEKLKCESDAVRLGGGKVSLSRLENSGWNEGLPVTRPFAKAIFKDLDHTRAHVVFGVQPRERLVRMERGGPAKTAVGLQFHAEERVVQTGEVVVVDAGIDECGG